METNYTFDGLFNSDGETRKLLDTWYEKSRKTRIENSIKDSSISIKAFPQDDECIKTGDIHVLLAGKPFPGYIQSITWSADCRNSAPMLEIKTAMQPFELEWLQKNTKVIVEVVE